MEGKTNPLVATWKKITVSKCSEIYPDEIEFRERGLYAGRAAGGPGRFTWWDSGQYEVTAERRVRISTANDAQIVYEFDVTADVLTFRDEKGCEFQYRRA